MTKPESHLNKTEECWSVVNVFTQSIDVVMWSCFVMYSVLDCNASMFSIGLWIGCKNIAHTNERLTSAFPQIQARNNMPWHLVLCIPMSFVHSKMVDLNWNVQYFNWDSTRFYQLFEPAHLISNNEIQCFPPRIDFEKFELAGLTFNVASRKKKHETKDIPMRSEQWLAARLKLLASQDMKHDLDRISIVLSSRNIKEKWCFDMRNYNMKKKSKQGNINTHCRGGVSNSLSCRIQWLGSTWVFLKGARLLKFVVTISAEKLEICWNDFELDYLLLYTTSFTLNYQKHF